jgi:hypothetical protein
VLGGMGHETAQSNLVRTQVFGEKDDVVAVDRAADRGDAVARCGTRKQRRSAEYSILDVTRWRPKRLGVRLL